MKESGEFWHPRHRRLFGSRGADDGIRCHVVYSRSSRDLDFREKLKMCEDVAQPTALRCTCIFSNQSSPMRAVEPQYTTFPPVINSSFSTCPPARVVLPNAWKTCRSSNRLASTCCAVRTLRTIVHFSRCKRLPKLAFPLTSDRDEVPNLW